MEWIQYTYCKNNILILKMQNILQLMFNVSFLTNLITIFLVRFYNIFLRYDNLLSIYRTDKLLLTKVLFFHLSLLETYH